MNKTKRPALLVGLVITTFVIVVYLISQLITNNQDPIAQIVFWAFVVILIFNICSFYTVNLSAKDFKKQMYLPWISFGLMLIYCFFVLAVILINSNNGIGSNDTLMIANLFIIVMGLLLFIPGILTKVIDNKITYEEHSHETNSEE